MLYLGIATAWLAVIREATAPMPRMMLRILAVLCRLDCRAVVWMIIEKVVFDLKKRM